MTIVASPESLGQDLRILRKQRGLTLTQLAQSIGRSVGWLSQVERNLSEPSMNELGALAKALDVSVDSFFGPVPAAPHEAEHIVRKDNRRPMSPRVPGLVEDLLSPDLTDDFEVVHSTFAAGAERRETVTRPTQEVGYIVSGELDITIDGKSFRLGEGDSFRIRGEPFSWANRGSDPCIAIWVIAPPVY
ncbi:MAG: XRE family transcriptional regulator [Paracoccaceae bacterium]|nr:XRE family transcriptional regulator [Paracoccaceae bacterium]